MTDLLTALQQLDNSRLLRELETKLGAKGWGTLDNFHEVPRHWFCPFCRRDKASIARLDAKGRLLCRLVFHHDHVRDYISLRAKAKAVDDATRSAAMDRFTRFQDTLLCEDCNNAEAEAKRRIGAPNFFSFAPDEIARFVVAKPGQPHTIDEAEARAIFEALADSRAQRLDRLTRFLDEVTVDPEWRSAGQVGASVVANIKRGGAA